MSSTSDDLIAGCFFEQNERATLESLIKINLKEKFDKKKFSEKETQDIAILPLRLLKETKKANLSIEANNIIREMCKTSEITLSDVNISSHRPVIGKLIIFVKKIVFKINKVLLKEILRQQRDFKYAVIKASVLSLGTNNK